MYELMNDCLSRDFHTLHVFYVNTALFVPQPSQQWLLSICPMWYRVMRGSRGLNIKIDISSHAQMPYTLLKRYSDRFLITQLPSLRCPSSSSLPIRTSSICMTTSWGCSLHDLMVLRKTLLKRPYPSSYLTWATECRTCNSMHAF